MLLLAISSIERRLDCWRFVLRNAYNLPYSTTAGSTSNQQHKMELHRRGRELHLRIQCAAPTLFLLSAPRLWPSLANRSSSLMTSVSDVLQLVVHGEYTDLLRGVAAAAAV